MESHRVAEALRVAIGLSGGEPENIHIVLLDNAPALLYQDPYDFEDDEAIENHLEAMKEYGLSRNEIPMVEEYIEVLLDQGYLYRDQYNQLHAVNGGLT